MNRDFLMGVDIYRQPSVVIGIKYMKNRQIITKNKPNILCPKMQHTNNGNKLVLFYVLLTVHLYIILKIKPTWCTIYS